MKKLLIAAILMFQIQGFAQEKMMEQKMESKAAMNAPAVGIKNFRSLFYSLIQVLELPPTDSINRYYQSVMNRLPKEGRLDEILNPTILMSIKGLASAFCQEYSLKNPMKSDEKIEDMLNGLSARIYGRALTANETKLISDVLSTTTADKKMLACTSMASSLEFLIQ
jgi:hypothetical protein